MRHEANTMKTKILASTEDNSKAAAVVSAAAQPSRQLDPVSPARETALRLITVLQTTLDLEAMLGLFSEEIGEVVPHDSVGYGFTDRSLNIAIGKPALHSCTYRMLAEQEYLGEVTFTRTHVFHESELVQIENLLSTLTYPLRNALQFQDVAQAALRDPLTGVSNRAVLDQSLPREIGLARRNGMPLSLLMLDIDHFKNVNDTYGHSTGDVVIKEIAGAISAAVRDSDMVCRYGGEEFSILLNNCQREGAVMLAERVRGIISGLQCRDTDGNIVKVTASIGIAGLTAEDDASSLLNRADQALYAAKNNGRDRCCLAKND